MSTNRYDFTIHENSGIRNAAKLLYVSSARYGGDWHSTPHTHSCTELFYVTGGSGQFYIENQIYPVSTHDLIIVNPQVEHTELSLNTSPLEYIVLGIEGLELSIADGSGNQFCIVNFRSIKDTLLFYLQNMLREVAAKTPGHEVICQNLMEILVVHLTRQTNYSATLTPIKSKTSRLGLSVHRYIDAHFKENINLDLLAEINHVSKYYMVHAFTEEYGISPINYMIACRIREARLLLKTTDYSQSVISRSLGFSSPSYFSQAFRKIEKMSPTEYRKEARRKDRPEEEKQPYTKEAVAK